jgi:hypothetical protein
MAGRVHPRVHERHPEILDADALSAWKNCIRSVPRVDKSPNEHLAVGADGNGRLMELVATRMADGFFVIFHAATPPTKKFLAELGLIERRRR